MEAAIFDELWFQDFEISEMKVPDMTTLRELITRRYYDGANRVYLWFGDRNDPSLRVFIQGDRCAIYYIDDNGDMSASIGDPANTEMVVFKDYIPGSVKDLTELPGASIVPWDQGLKSLIYFAQTGGRYPDVQWEEL